MKQLSRITGEDSSAVCFSTGEMWTIVLFFGTQFPLCSGEGRTFMLPVTSINEPDSETWVVITGQGGTTVTLTSPPYDRSKTFEIGAENSISVPLQSKVMYGNSGAIEGKGLQVVSDHDVSVQVVTSLSDGNTESYQALPKNVWSDKFYVSQHTVPTGSRSFVTIAAYDDDTSVDIEIPASAGTTPCKEITLQEGEILSETLDSMDVWGVRCDKDLTGTYIRSTKAISVVAGVFDTKRVFVEMMIPVQLYGVNFVLPNISDVDIVFRVVASEDGTIVKTWNSTYAVGQRSYMDIDRKGPETMCIQTTKPVQVQMLLCSPDSNVTAFMITITPVERYRTAFRIPPSPANVSQRLMIYVTERRNKLSLEREVQHITVVEELGCCNYITFVGSENVDSHVTLDLPFPVMILQYSVQLGGVEGLNAGFDMGSPTCPTEKGYQYDEPSKFCFKVVKERETWTKSVQLCESWFRHHLATLDSQSKNVALQTFLKESSASDNVWIGGQTRSGYGWTWPNNVTISNTDYSNWGPGQPNGSSSCLALYKPFDYKWDDLVCSFNARHACELRLEAVRSAQLLETPCPSENPNCPSSQGYSYFAHADLCIKLHATAMNWTMANSQCQAHGDRLVKVESQLKAGLIASFAEQVGRVYIGASRQNTSDIANSGSGDFVWTDRSPIDVDLWAQSEPNNHGGVENCVQLRTTSGGKFNDIRCANVYSFICEKTGEKQLVSDAYDGSCLDQSSNSSNSSTVDLQPSSLSGGDGSTSASSDAGITPHPAASPVTVSAPSIPATVYTTFSSSSVGAAVNPVSTVTVSLTPSTVVVAATSTPNTSSDSSVTLGTGFILDSRLATSSTAFADADADATTTSIATGLTTLMTEPSLTQVSTAAGLTPLTTEPSLTQVSTAAGLTPLTTEPSLPQVSTAAGLTPLTTEPSLTQVSTAAGLTSLTTEPSLTQVSSAAGLTPLTTEPSLTQVSTAAGLTPLTATADPTSPTSSSAVTISAASFLPTTASTSATLPTALMTAYRASPDLAPPGELNVSNWDKSWEMTFGPWERVSGRWKRLVCRCACVPKRLKTLFPSGVDAVKENIQSNLILDNKNLTKKAAKYSSAKDDRISARGMGYGVMCLISLPFILIVLADVLTCLYSVHQNKK